VPLSYNGYIYGIIASNLYGINTANVTLAVSDSPATLTSDISPLTAEAYAGAPVIYTVGVQGNSPITYQWTVNGNVVSGATSNRMVLTTPCGGATVQVAFSNILNSSWVTTSLATLQSDASPTNLTFNVNGTGWQSNTNGTGTGLGAVTNGVLLLTDGAGGEASSAFYKTQQYVGGAWTASFTYDSHGGGADGAAFILQSTNATAIGGPGGELGYGGITNSLAFEINLYPGNSQTIGIAMVTNATTGVYQSALPVNVNSTNSPINVVLNWSGGVLTATLTDSTTGATYSTNHVYGSVVPILGGNTAFIGFSGGDGGITAVQTISNFSFHSVLPSVALAASPVTGNSFTLSWSAADPSYVLQTTTSLSSPSWATGPTPTVVSGTNQVSVNVTSGSGQQYYRLVRVACP
jgi:hypothetical protein